MRRTSTRCLALYLLAAFVSGCEDEPQQLFQPAVSSITVDDAVHRQSAAVDVALTNPGAANLRVKGVTMAYRPTGEAAGEFVPVEEIVLESSGNNYSGQLPPLSLGSYEVRVTAVFGPRPSVDEPTPLGPDTIKTRMQPFTVTPGGEACFTFGSPEEVEQWTHGGYIDHGSGEQTCPGIVQFTQAGGGALIVPISNACVDPEGEDFYRFDLSSPDVSANGHWQPANMNGVFMFASSAPASRMQAILTTDAERSFATVDSEGEFAFAEIDSGPAFQAVSMTFGELPQDESVTQLRVRVFGDVEAGLSTAEGFFQLSTVCALP